MINGWSDDNKYKWLNAHVMGNAHVTGNAHKIIVRLQKQVMQPTYQQAIDAL